MAVNDTQLDFLEHERPSSADKIEVACGLTGARIVFWGSNPLPTIIECFTESKFRTEGCLRVSCWWRVPRRFRGSWPGGLTPR